MIKGLCAGSGASVGGNMGGARWNKATCPICGRKIAMRPGRAGRLYSHAGTLAALLKAKGAK